MVKKQMLKYKQMPKEELGKFLCDLVEDVVYSADDNKCACDYCPAQNECKLNHNGFIDWLDDENV